MNHVDALLRDPTFWANFFDGMPPSAAVNISERALAVIAVRTGRPLSYVKARLEDYMRARRVEINGLAHPGSDAIN
jgi:hypothetical protein